MSVSNKQRPMREESPPVAATLVSQAFVPGEPLYGPAAGQQWHFFRIGNIERIWDEYTGAGVAVGVYDDGVQYTHPDLDGNYDASRHVVIEGVTYDGTPVGDNGHGTAVAGLIAAENDGVGAVGVAFDASITGIPIFSTGGSAIDVGQASATDAPFFEAIRLSGTFDIVNNSWAWRSIFGDYSNVRVEFSFARVILDAWHDAVAQGRGGLGTIVVHAAGNDQSDSAFDSVKTDRVILSVAAVDIDSVGRDISASSFSNHGAAILVAAPGAALATTDLVDAQGYDTASSAGGGDYVEFVSGTSLAAPIVSGVVALMLEANSSLGWRDVKDILAASATRVGGQLGATAPYFNENGVWQINGAEGWNGGGMHIHTNYGYGMVNAYNAVRMAEVWNRFTPAPETFANEIRRTTGVIQGDIDPGSTADTNIPDLGTLTRTFAFSGDIEIDHVQFVLSVSHPTYSYDLRIELISAAGTRIQLWGDQQIGGNTVIIEAPNTVAGWSYGIEGLRGEDPNGTWTLEITDVAPGDSGWLNWFELNIYGSPATTNDVFHFTDEYAEMAAFQSARRTIADSNGGIDWINAAAVTTGSAIDLRDGRDSSIDGTTVTIAAGTAIEHAIGGDGQDSFMGNDGGNQLLGMRGDDRLDGGDGTDTLEGGAGADWLDGGGDNDRLFGGEGDDTLDGGDGNDTMVGGRGGDQFGGGAGTHDIVSYAGPDAVQAGLSFSLPNLGAAEGDAIYGGIEGLEGSDANDTLGGDFEDNFLYGRHGNDLLYGFEGLDILEGGDGNDTLLGDSGDDTLNGGLGADSMEGGEGNDSYRVDDPGDVLTEQPNSGYDRVIASISHALVAEVERLTLSGSANLNGTGNALANRLDGNAGANILDGGEGNDALIGGAGNDTLIGGAGHDALNGGRGADSLDGGEGRDMLSYAGSAHGVVVNLATQTVAAGDAEGDRISGFENVSGGQGADHLTGDAFANGLSGGAGADTLIGGAGNDALNGGQGADSLDGGEGRDMLSYAGSAHGVVVNLAAQTVAAGDAEGDWISGFENVSGGQGADHLTGDGFANVLIGGAGADTLIGGAGHDVLHGGLGADSMMGGEGADRFLFRSVSEANGDVITDFSAAEGDRIDLRAIDANALDPALHSFTWIDGAAFTGVSGQLRFAGEVLEGDVQGDGLADFRITLSSVASLSAGNILL